MAKKLNPNQMLGAMLLAEPFIRPFLEREAIRIVLRDELSKVRLVIPEETKPKKKSKSRKKKL